MNDSLNDQIPMEVTLLKAKNEMVSAINHIGSDYGLPSVFIIFLLNEIISESKLNTYSTTLSSYDISLPKTINPVMSNQSIEADKNND